jgi:CheY-like chemotaxis protein
MKTDEERCLAAGMDAYLSKPVQPKELIELTEKLAVTSWPAPTHLENRLTVDRAQLRVNGTARSEGSVDAQAESS